MISIWVDEHGLPARRAAAPRPAGAAGDKDQLASVEAGALLGDLCRDAEGGFYAARGPAPGWRRSAARRWPIRRCRTVRRTVARWLSAPSDAAPLAALRRRLGISRLARAVNGCDPAVARAILGEDRDDLHLLALRGEQDAALERLLLDGRPAQAGNGRKATPTT